MTASALAAITLIVLLVVVLVILIWTTPDPEEEQSDDSGGGSQRLHPRPRHRGPHGGARLPAPARSRTPAIRSRPRVPR